MIENLKSNTLSIKLNKLMNAKMKEIRDVIEKKEFIKILFIKIIIDKKI